VHGDLLLVIVTPPVVSRTGGRVGEPGLVRTPQGLGEEAVDGAGDDGEEYVEVDVRATAEDKASR